MEGETLSLSLLHIFDSYCRLMCVSDQHPEGHVTSCVCSKPTVVTLGFFVYSNLWRRNKLLGKKYKTVKGFFCLLFSILLHIISSCHFQSIKNASNERFPLFKRTRRSGLIELSPTSLTCLVGQKTEDLENKSSFFGFSLVKACYLEQYF